MTTTQARPGDHVGDVGNSQACAAACPAVRPAEVLVSDQDLERVERAAPEVLTAIAQVSHAATQIRSGHRSLTAEDALAVVRTLEDLHRRVDALSAEATAVFTREGNPHSYGANSVRSLLREHLKLSAAEATRRAKLADTIGTRTTLTGVSLQPPSPVLSAGMHEAEFSACQIAHSADILTRIKQQVHRPDMDKAEHILAESLRTVQLSDLPTVGRRLLDVLNPDGRPPNDQTHPGEYFVTVVPKPNGDWKLSGLLNPTTGATLHALFTTRMKSRPGQHTSSPPEPPGATQTAQSGSPGPQESCVPGGGDLGEELGPDDVFGDLPVRGIAVDGSDFTRQVPRDDRPDGARRHDVLTEIVSSGARERTRAGGAFALVISATADQVAAGQGEVTTQCGTRARLEDVLDLSAGGQFYYRMSSPDAGTIAVRTEKRFANAHQLALLTARDHGCSFPDCDMPAGWCEAHHIVPYSRGGPTDVNNMTLACSFHHHWHERSGWVATMVGGLPAWIPPGYIDRDRKPVFHSRFRTALLNYAAPSWSPDQSTRPWPNHTEPDQPPF